ncbi:glycosyltransferase family 2 protein [Spirosoma radiotolerans]|uniref:Glycosyl transferase family 2 n=1 Tax=Spirosoma radiotolerans TaxID=1379870 RepID=A0A0E3ZX31_9BACT|nr:glycosyltransferase [Spirosoma radiotolerans]AKD56914.1 glycosyl transferase family 2 [Spirosoma radiotolerans]
MLPEFSVVIPTYQQPALLLKCLDALGRQRLSHDQFEIIVVDEGNSPETETAVLLFARQIARDGTPIEVRYLGQPQRRGLAAARNRGWRAARGRVIAFTDEDCLPEPTWLSAALTCFQRGAQVLSGQLRVHLPNQPTPLDRTATFLKRAEFMASNCFCRKSTLDRVGGFEEAFDTDWREDSDLQFKFLQVGIPIAKCPEAVVVYPIRPCPWYELLQDERNNCYDALLYKRHPDLFRERIPTYRRQVIGYYASVGSIVLGLVGLLSGQMNMAIMGLCIWAVLSVDRVLHHLPSTPLTWPILKQVVATALATPFLSVYWRLYGAVKYRVLYF